MEVLKNLEPEKVFFYFEELCKIPHGSRNTKAISDYCAAFAREHKLRYIQDDSNNIIIFKDGSVGYEKSAAVILQGHLDMVCEKDADCEIDFTKDGLTLEVHGDDITARGTTLGGDDGIAVAFALAILSDDSLPHPPLEVVLTVDEEIGMLGAAALDCSPLKGRIMLNLDSEDEGKLLVSCAGGVTAVCRLPITREQEKASPLATAHGKSKYTLSVSGLAGGHSGVEIDKGRANANQLLGRLLFALSKEIDLRLCSIQGGLKDNAIPREASADFIAADSDLPPEKLKKQLEAFVKQWTDILKHEYKNADPDITIAISGHTDSDTSATAGHAGNIAAISGRPAVSFLPLTPASTKCAITALYNLPGGVIRMSRDIEGLVQTSLNMGILKTKTDEIIYSFSVRSSLATEKAELLSRMECLMDSLGGSISLEGDYPAWEYRTDSPLRELMVTVFKEQYGYPPEIQALHAGVECGLFAGKLPGLDCVSFGPMIQDIHTPKERLSISSCARTWQYTLEILKRLK